MEDAKQRFIELRKKNDENKSRKIRLEEKMKSAKASLVSVMTEIKDEGIDPSKIKSVLQEKEEALREGLEKLEAEVQETSSKLDEIEDKL